MFVFCFLFLIYIYLLIIFLNIKNNFTGVSNIFFLIKKLVLYLFKNNYTERNRV